ncbi:cytochrome b-c1 complex subunit 7-2-like isoform X2 [Abrus precatorius]|uniref:Cytochrome b-c1 complex subunit 7 n=1 Tax=Abrus precatorius TaxID=3816 RepID=A0A8B8JNE9_ABRPR|nr:cytochrome b-c1 complex subunit 7-2-like isoform X2 [Abrus precatorius]
MASFLQSFLDPKKNWFAAQHMKSLSKRLRKYGLRYDDLYDPYYDIDVKEALNRLPKEIVDARHARLKRAIDLSMKHEYLPEDLQVKRERAERDALGGLPLYQRTIP